MTGESKTKLESTDPICGMTVSPETAAGSFQHEGTTYYFCSKGCLQNFINQTSGEAQPQTNLVQFGRKKETVQHGEMVAAPTGEFIDPVCGMRVAPESSAGTYEYGGETFYFCSSGLFEQISSQNPTSLFRKEKAGRKIGS
ncbi:MAG: YHS domain-containing protein [Pyrinomonadaceae bacterium]